MNRIQLRTLVRNYLRDDGFPTEAINDALERTIQTVNNGDRYRCQQSSETLTLVTGTYKYAVTSTILGEEVMVFQVGVAADQKIIPKGPSMADAIANGAFLTTGNAPSYYIRWENYWWFDPIPTSTANSKLVTVFNFRDITVPTNDVTALPLPARYHSTLLVYGTLAEIAPAMQIVAGEGKLTATFAFQQALKTFRDQELWEPLKAPNLIRDVRWHRFNRAGNVGSVRNI